MRLNKKLAALGGAVVLVAGGATVAMADIPDSTTGEITACRTTTGGQVRIIDKENSESCHSYETEMSWPSEAGSVFTPKQYLTVNPGKLAEFGGVTGNKNYECPTGEKLISATSGQRVGSTTNYPGVGTNGNNFTESVPPIAYIKDANDVLIGATFQNIETTGYAQHVMLTCTP